MSFRPITLSYFLPQYHSCPYNNKWWGEGFTEWNNVREAVPLFEGQHQPRVPKDGYFDLLERDELEKQYGEASKAGVDGFAIYHYWYEGQKPLGAVLENILEHKDLDVRFSICWANHSWTRSWRNNSGALDVLIEQTYENSQEDMVKHFMFLEKCFLDDRYVTIDGKPIFQIYAPENIGNLDFYLRSMRTYFSDKHGLDIHIAATVKRKNPDLAYLAYFDSLTLNQPTLALFSDVNILGTASPNRKSFKLRDVIQNLPNWAKKYVFRLWDILPSKHTVYDYDATWQKLITQSKAAIEESIHPINLTSFVEFDNTPRYKNRATILSGFTVQKFEKYTGELYNLACEKNTGIFFINAWNEWGEGMYLQSDDKYNNTRLTSLGKVILNEDL